MITATIDTNIILCGLISNRGASYQILHRLIEKQFIAQISVPIFLEYESILKRQENLKLTALTAKDIDVFLTFIAKAAQSVERIYYLWRPLLLDENDNIFVECAVTAGSQYLVTNNINDYKQCNRLFSFQVIKPGEFLKLIDRRDIR